MTGILVNDVVETIAAVLDLVISVTVPVLKTVETGVEVTDTFDVVVVNWEAIAIVLVTVEVADEVAIVDTEITYRSSERMAKAPC